MPKTVKVPAKFESIFESAENLVGAHFENINLNPEKGIVEINGERYILVRADSMSMAFSEYVRSVSPIENDKEAFEAAAQMLFDLAHSIGKEDSKNCHTKLNLEDPIERLSTGPVHFAFTGWAFVEILEDSNPSQDEDYFLVYNHPQSFEADAWLKNSEGYTDSCRCYMNAGYSSGWCSKSFGLNLEAKEILCRAKGDDECRFVMATEKNLNQKVKEYCEKEGIPFPS